MSLNRVLASLLLVTPLAISSLAQTRPATATASQPTTRPSVPIRKAAAAAREWITKPAREVQVESPSAAVEIRERTYDRPKALRVWIARIDMTVAGVRAVVTPPAEGLEGDEAKFETRCENTLEFAQRTGVQLALNTSAFAPFRPRAGLPMDVVGESAAEGRVYSPPERNHDAMYVSKDGRVALKRSRAPASQPATAPIGDRSPSEEGDVPPDPAPPANDAWHIIPGFRLLIDDGKIVVRQRESDSNFGGVNPRTAVATDRAGKTLWVVVVDGRQPGVSVGMTLVELAVLFESLGAWDALNLDGGGSTTLVVQQLDGSLRVLNTPVGQKAPGSLRQVANNLGFQLPARKP